jgi:hypothetical protein
VKAKRKFIPVLLVLSCFLMYAQKEPKPKTFLKGNKMGCEWNGKEIIPPVYDTIFAFDATNTICMACNEVKATPSKFIKVATKSYECKYLNKNNQAFYLKRTVKDSSCLFGISKNTVKQYQSLSNYFVATYGGKKYLVSKNFNVITPSPFNEIYFTQNREFFITETKTENNAILLGLINSENKLIIPSEYSGIKVNDKDSLIIACSSQSKVNGEDDVYNYQGKKVHSFRRHIEQANKKYILYHIFEPNNYFIVLNRKTNEEKPLNGQNVTYVKDDTFAIKSDGNWFYFDIVKNIKTPFEKREKTPENNEQNQGSN